MSDIAIRVENLSKRYRIGLKEEMHDTMAGALVDLARRPMHNLRRLRRLTRFSENGQGPEQESDDVIWALRDVSFEVRRGEALGIIGRNGAGKSTLLKVLSRITHPTSGRVELNGRISSLLEVGTGFHGELTGRENVYLNATILGMRKVEVDRKFDEIVDFSGVEKFIDTPVKRYSSGMRVRLAFSVAAHLEPEILLIDEVLAVGDAEFQKKCLGKMEDVSGQGRTVLFVSHNMNAIQSLCERVIWLQDGRSIADGLSSEVVGLYLRAMDKSKNARIWPDMNEAPGTDTTRLRRAFVLPADNGVVNDNRQNSGQGKLITMATPIVLGIDIVNLEAQPNLDITLHLVNEEGIVVLGTSTGELPDRDPFPAGVVRAMTFIPGSLLNAGYYQVRLLLVESNTRVVFKSGPIVSFEVADVPERHGNWHGRLAGVVRPLLEWRFEQVDALNV